MNIERFNAVYRARAEVAIQGVARLQSLLEFGYVPEHMKPRAEEIVSIYNALTAELDRMAYGPKSARQEKEFIY